MSAAENVIDACSDANPATLCTAFVTVGSLMTSSRSTQSAFCSRDTPVTGRSPNSCGAMNHGPIVGTR